MDTGSPKDFFISYTHADQHWAEWIAWLLEAEGYHTRIQTWDFLAGNNFVLEMDAATRQATRTIAVLSPDYFTSQFTPSEWAAAFKRDPKGDQGLLLPVRVRPCDVEGLLGQVVYIDLVDQDEATARATLLHGITHQRRKPSTPPVFPSTQQASQSHGRPSFPGALPAVWNIPYPRNPYFTGREELLRLLAASLRAGETVGISQPQAVHGLGGVGKTQIALEYAYRYYQDYDAVLWTRADTQETLISGFVVFASLLQLPVQEERDQLKIVQAVKGWLTSHRRWLLLLDNADDLTLVRDFLPPAGKGHALLTTRASSMGRLAHPLEVDALYSEPGAMLLLRRANRLAPDAPLEQAEVSERAIAQQITQELGGLPLALDQAGAYIEETKCSLADYLPLYRSQRSDLLKTRGGLVFDHPEPVATTWSLSFAQVEKRSAAAADLLRVCSFLHPDAIPEEIFTEGSAALGPELQAVVQNPLFFNQAIGVLLSYSLLKRQPEEHLLGVHRLVQAVIQDAMPESEREGWIKRVIVSINAVFPVVEYTTWKQCERLVPHVLFSANYTASWKQVHLALASLLLKTADYLYARAQYNEVEILYQRSLHIREQALGPDHLQVAYPLHGLGGLYRKQHKNADAEPLYERVLRIHEQAYGLNDPKVGAPLTNLARVYSDQGKYAEAETLYQRSLRIQEQAYGLDDPDMAYPLQGLAGLYEKQGKYAEAEPLYQRALHIWERALEPNHPDMAYPLTNLAILYENQGKYAEAEPLYQRALRIREQALGSDHPYTRTVVRNYARLLRKTAREAEASQLELRFPSS